MKKILFHKLPNTILQEEVCIRETDSIKFKRIIYKGYWIKPIGQRKKMNIRDKDGRAVRCIDCVNRKNCNYLRVNKYERKPCNYYVSDLSKQARIVQQKIRKNK